MKTIRFLFELRVHVKPLDELGHSEIVSHLQTPHRPVSQLFLKDPIGVSWRAAELIPKPGQSIVEWTELVVQLDLGSGNCGKVITDCSQLALLPYDKWVRRALVCIWSHKGGRDA